MKLYRLEEVIKPTAKTPWEWCAYELDSYQWVPKCNGQDKTLRDNWIDNMLARAALRLGTESESRKGYYCTYFLVREPWPEQVIENLIAQVQNLESEVSDLRLEIRTQKDYD